MKIAVNTRFLLPGKLEGLGWYTHEIMRRMVLQHPEDQFFFLFDRPFDARFVYAENVQPLRVFPPARHPLLWYAWFEWAVPRVLRSIRPDVFFSPDAYLSLGSRVKTVMTVHDLSPLHAPEQVPLAPRMYYRHFLPRYIRRADKLVAISDYTRQDIIRTCGADAGTVAVAYNGCREGFRPLDEQIRQQTRMRFSGGAPYFFYTGAIHPRKNIPRLLQAFDRMKNSTGAPVKLLLAGRMAWHTDEVNATWNACAHKNDIIFLGYVPENDLPLLTGSALAAVNVSLYEGFGLPLVEAMYADTPLVCSNTTALSEVGGAAALQVDPLQTDAIAAALQRIWQDASLRQRCMEAGREHRQQYQWDRAADTIYRQLLSTQV